MTWQQFLTEKGLGEEWLEPPPNHRDTCSCYECVDCRTYNRTFDNRNDLMDLYEQIWKDGKWIQFEEYSSDKWDKLYPYMMKTAKIISFTPWLFCLDGKDYEPRCKLVSEFYGWEGKCL